MTKNNLKVYLSKKLLLIFVLIFCISKNNFSQAPAVEWYNTSWVDHEYKNSTYVDQRHSSYDWWYDHCTGYVDPINKTGHIGYIACGIGFYRCAERSNPNAAAITYNETDVAYGSYADGCSSEIAPLFGPGDDYGNWDNPVTGHLGLDFNQIGLINPDGTTGFVHTVNYGGEYFRVKQLQDGSYLSIGKSEATRQRIDAPQNGAPLYYNPNSAHPNDYFKRTEIFVSGVTSDQNENHWDVLKFDVNGNTVFNNLYGLFDFNNTTAVNSTFYDQGSIVTRPLIGKQRAYYSGGIAFDFIQEPSTTNNGNIAIVGLTQDDQDGTLGKASIVKIDNNGNYIGSMFVCPISPSGSVARAIEFATIAGIDYYIIGVTQGTNSGNSVEIYALKTNLSAPAVLLKTFSANGTSFATVWDFAVKNNVLYLPLINDCNNVWSAGDITGKLYAAKLDLNNTTINYAPVFLSNIHAFDLKARITDLSDGNFAIVSARKTADWATTVCPGSTPPNYITGDYSATPNTAANTNWWNTDTYVAKISTAPALIWDKSFDSNSAFSCTDYPINTNGGSGDVKRQECMYGISEAPDGGIVLSGNISQNYDDNYLVKLYSDCNAQQPYDITGIMNVSITSGLPTVTINS